MGNGVSGTGYAPANSTGNVCQRGASSSADSLAQSEFDKVLQEEKATCTDPMKPTPREEALQRSLPESERHRPPPISRTDNAAEASLTKMGTTEQEARRFKQITDARDFIIDNGKLIGTKYQLKDFIEGVDKQYIPGFKDTLNKYGYEYSWLSTTNKEDAIGALNKYEADWIKNNDVSAATKEGYKGYNQSSVRAPDIAAEERQRKKNIAQEKLAEGMSYVTSSIAAGAFATAASWFTDDPTKITAAAGMGAAWSGATGAVMQAAADRAAQPVLPAPRAEVTPVTTTSTAKPITPGRPLTQNNSPLGQTHAQDSAKEALGTQKADKAAVEKAATKTAERADDKALDETFKGGKGEGAFVTAERLKRGNLGEKLATDALAAEGHKILSFKPSILGTNQGGIDMVTIKDGVVHFFDNKALSRSGNVSSVSALTTNFEKNKGVALNELKGALAKAVSKEEKDVLQSAVTAIEKGNYKKVVTNANLAKDDAILSGVSQALKNGGIEFIDVFKPRGSD